MSTTTIPPVFVLSTGRCGSTMVSDILNSHPEILSLSELFAYTGLSAFGRGRRSGEWMWELLGRHQGRTRFLAGGDYEELIYPFDRPGARFTRTDVPPIMCTTLPHLTERHEELYDELEPVVRGWPRRRAADQYRQLFDWLCQRFDRRVWVERSGGSLFYAGIVRRRFPEARIIHVYRDGRDVALSMSRHYLFRIVVASLSGTRKGKVDLLTLMKRDRIWELLLTRLMPAVTKFLGQRTTTDEDFQLADFGKFWNDLIQNGNRVFGSLPSDSLLNVKFEDVQANPENQIRRIVRFIAPELEDDNWIREASSIPRPGAPRYPQLAPEELARITQVCRPGLELLGYPV